METIQVDILLATYNSERYLQAQLDSIFAQDFANFRVLARDGGSTDRTMEILREYQAREPERLIVLVPERSKARRNFAALLAASDAPLTMFADHDDVWLPDKISVSVEALHALEREFGLMVPLLVFTDSQVVDRDLGKIADSMLHYQHLNPYDLALTRLCIQNAPSGNTMLFNRALRELALPIPAQAVMHDHWMTLVAAAFGKIGFLDRPTLLYRQHCANVFGATAYSLPSMLCKMREGRRKILRRLYLNIRQTEAFVGRYRARLAEEDRAALEAFVAVPHANFWTRRWIFWRYRIRKSGFWRNVGLYLIC